MRTPRGGGDDAWMHAGRKQPADRWRGGATAATMLAVQCMEALESIAVRMGIQYLAGTSGGIRTLYSRTALAAKINASHAVSASPCMVVSCRLQHVRRRLSKTSRRLGNGALFLLLGESARSANLVPS